MTLWIPAASAGDAALVAVALTLTAYEGYLAFKRPNGWEHLWRGVFSLAAAWYAALIGVHYLVDDHAAALLLTKLEAGSILVGVMTAPWLAGSLLGRPVPWPLRWMLLVPVSACLALLPTDLLISGRAQMRDYRWVDQPFLHMVQTPVMWAAVTVSLVIAAGSLAWLWSHRRRRPRSANLAALGVILWVGSQAVEQTLWLSGLGAPIHLLDYGMVSCAVAIVFADVQRNAELLEDTERALDQVVGAASDAIVAIDRSGTVQEVNQVFVAWLGLGPDHDLQGYPFADVVADDDLDTWDQLLAGEGVATLTLIRPDGDPVVVEATILRPRWRADLVVMRDVTARERAHARRVEAGRADAIEMLGSAVGVGLHGPLGSLETTLRALYAHVASSHDVDLARVQEDLRASVLAVDDMDHWLDTLRPVTTPGPKLQAVSVLRVANAAAALAGPAIADRAHVQVTVDAELRVAGQPRAIARAILDLIQHATFGLEPGHVEDNVVHVEAMAGEDLVLIRVREQFPHTLLPDDEPSVPPFPLGMDGAGVGLAACREAVRAMGGRLTVRPGAGGFEIALPRAPVG